MYTALDTTFFTSNLFTMYYSFDTDKFRELTSKPEFIDQVKEFISAVTNQGPENLKSFISGPNSSLIQSILFDENMPHDDKLNKLIEFKLSEFSAIERYRLDYLHTLKNYKILSDEDKMMLDTCFELYVANDNDSLIKARDIIQNMFKKLPKAEYNNRESWLTWDFESLFSNIDSELIRRGYHSKAISKQSPYWYCCPHECFKLNRLLTFWIMKELEPDTKWYYIQTEVHGFVSNTNDVDAIRNNDSNVIIADLFWSFIENYNITNAFRQIRNVRIYDSLYD